MSLFGLSPAELLRDMYDDMSDEDLRDYIKRGIVYKEGNDLYRKVGSWNYRLQNVSMKKFKHILREVEIEKINE